MHSAPSYEANGFRVPQAKWCTPWGSDAQREETGMCDIPKMQPRPPESQFIVFFRVLGI